jgi:predicted TIM-barrel fold metal-dependent hydrolase
MRLKDFRPRSQLVVQATSVTRPRFPVIDAHNHLAEPFGGGWDKRPVAEVLDALDQAGVRHYVDLDGGAGETILQAHLDHFKAAAPDRFTVFGGVDWGQWPERGDAFPDWAAGRLRQQWAWGARGLKIWKSFGLQVVDARGERVRVDDERLDVLWSTAADLKLPVVIHAADPVAFFDPVDETNERWEELGEHPEWAFTSPPHPPFQSILDALARLVARHPQTTFVGAHVGGYAENLEWVSGMLDRCSNYQVDLAARFGELGRQPYAARRFCERYADRVLFGLDMGPDLRSYRLAYRLLETEDEYFNYSAGPIPTQGRWMAYGLHLSDDALEKIYSGNAERILRL